MSSDDRELTRIDYVFWNEIRKSGIHQQSAYRMKFVKRERIQVRLAGYAYAGVRQTLAPFPLVAAIPSCSSHGRGSLLSMPENSRNNRTRVYEASMSANSSVAGESIIIQAKSYVKTYDQCIYEVRH